MKTIALISLVAASLLVGCSSHEEKPSFSDRVAYFYYLDEKDSVSGFTRFDKGLPGTSTRVNEDVWLDVYADYVFVTIKNRADESYIIPRERIKLIAVGNPEGNELNIPK